MNFNFTNAKDFLRENSLTLDEGIKIVDAELKKILEEKDEGKVMQDGQQT